MVLVLSERISISPVVNHLLMTILKLEVEGEKTRNLIVEPQKSGTWDLSQQTPVNPWEKRTTNSMSFHSTRAQASRKKHSFMLTSQPVAMCFFLRKEGTYLDEWNISFKFGPFSGEHSFHFRAVTSRRMFHHQPKTQPQNTKKQQKIPPATKSDHFNFSLKKKCENSCILKLFESPLTKRWGGIP